MGELNIHATRMNGKEKYEERRRKNNVYISKKR